MRRLLLLILVGGLLVACAANGDIQPRETASPAATAALPEASVPPSPQPANTIAQDTTLPAPPPTITAVPSAAPDSAVPDPATPAATAAVDTPLPASPPATLAPGAWKDLPVLPELSPHDLSVIRDGLSRGNNPRAFSKIGDCESRTTWFLGDFDLDKKNYALGPYEADLAPVVNYYHGSFNRLSMAAKPGFTSASVMSLLWTDRQACNKNENPLACEYRLNKPVLAFIMLGTNDASNPKTFEGHMRKIIEFSLDQGVLPVLGTKADNVEGDESINATIARLAVEYDIPLWNYWRAVQDLPDHGLQEDGQHLTFGPTRFDDPTNLENAWPVRNLNAMQILKMVMEQTQ